MTKIRLLTGVYIFQTTKVKFDRSGEVSDSNCIMCNTEPEDIIHFMIQCPALSQARQRFHAIWNKEFISVFGLQMWNRISKQNFVHVQAILDITKCCTIGVLPKVNRRAHTELERLSMILCHALHRRRASILARRVNGDHIEDVTGEDPVDGGPTERLKFQRKV